MTGIVYKSTGSWYTVKTLNGKVYECRIKGKFRIKGIKSTNPISVGDYVEFELDTKSDKTTGIINNIQERKNYIVRKSVNLSKQTHIIASNIDQVFLLITIDNPLLYSSNIQSTYQGAIQCMLKDLAVASAVILIYTKRHKTAHKKAD